MFFHLNRCLPAIAASLALGLALELAPARADDSVSRKSTNTRLGGMVSESTRTELTLKPRKGDPIAIPANDILMVDWDDAPADFKAARTEEGGGRFESALQKLAKCAADSKTGSEFYRADVAYYTARATARSALADPSRLDDAVAKLTAFFKTYPNNFRFYDAQQLLGQTYLARQEFDLARTAFETLGQAPWSDYQLNAQVNLGRVLMGENKLDAATQAFDVAINAAAAGTSAADKAARYEAMLGKARSLIAQNRHADAMASLTEVIDNAPQDDSALQAEAYVLQGNCLRAQDKTKEAVLAYLHVDVLFDRESASHAEALYHLAKLWKAVQHPDRALEAQAKLERDYPKSAWAQKLGAAAAE